MTAILITWQDLKRFLRDPVGLLMMLVLPLVLIVSLGFVSGRVPLGPAPRDGFDALSYIAPGMALFFMMFTVRQEARNGAEDEAKGLRDRIRVSPAGAASIAAGGALSRVALVFAQLAVLVGVSSILYGIGWGKSGPLALLCLVLAAAAGGWIAFLGAIGHTPNRIGNIGTALTLVFAILSRSFAAVIPGAPWMDALARVTPNYWGLRAFTGLAMGGELGSIAGDLLALALMTAALLAASPIAARLTIKRR